MSIKERLGHKFPPDFFLLACFPPGFSSRQTFLLAFKTPVPFFPQDIILQVDFTPFTLVPQMQISNYSPMPLYPQTLFPRVDFPPIRYFT